MDASDDEVLCDGRSDAVGGANRGSDVVKSMVLICWVLSGVIEDVSWLIGKLFLSVPLMNHLFLSKWARTSETQRR